MDRPNGGPASSSSNDDHETKDLNNVNKMEGEDCTVVDSEKNDGDKTVENNVFGSLVLNHETKDLNNVNKMEGEDCTVVDSEKNDGDKTVENNVFGSLVLDSKQTDSDKTELPCSFATLSEKYNKLKCDVVVAKGNISTLSMICENYQDSSSDDDDTSSDDFLAEELLIDSDDENKTAESSNTVKDKCIVKTKGELQISDLPPIEDLKISVEESKCEPVGCVKNVVDTLVIIETFLNQPALDIDSILFVDCGQRALGRIFDVFGPVNKPYYAVRFNDSDHIKNFNVQIKELVYCAPKTEYATFVLVSQLLQLKGSDASWKNNNEPPPEYLDYSDDEAEKLAKQNRKQKKSRRKVDKKDKEDKPADPTTIPDVGQDNDVQEIMTTSPSTRYYNETPQMQMYPAHHPYYPRHPTHYGYGRFPSYAQHLRAMDYSHAYRQPYNPWYYNHMYPSNYYPFNQQNNNDQQQHHPPRYMHPQQRFHSNNPDRNFM